MPCTVNGRLHNEESSFPWHVQGRQHPGDKLAVGTWLNVGCGEETSSWGELLVGRGMMQTLALGLQHMK